MDPFSLKVDIDTESTLVVGVQEGCKLCTSHPQVEGFCFRRALKQNSYLHQTALIKKRFLGVPKNSAHLLGEPCVRRVTCVHVCGIVITFLDRPIFFLLRDVSNHESTKFILPLQEWIELSLAPTADPRCNIMQHEHGIVGIHCGVMQIIQVSNYLNPQCALLLLLNGELPVVDT